MLRSEEKEEAAACLKRGKMRDVKGRGWSHQQIDKKDFPESEIIYED